MILNGNQNGAVPSQEHLQVQMETKLAKDSPSTPEKDYKCISNRNTTPSKEEPNDRYNIVRITMYLFGISCLLPWNFFIQANDYWMYKFRNASIDENLLQPEQTSAETELQSTFPSYLAIASKVPYVLFLLVNTLIANRFRSTARFQIPLLVMILLFVITIILVPVNTDNNQKAFFSATICIVIAINVACGFVQGAGTGIAGSFPKEFMGYNVNGMAIGGIVASIAQIGSLAGNTSPVVSAGIYFALAIFILCLTFVLFRVAIRTDFYQYHMSKQISTNQTAFSSSTMAIFEIFKKLWVYAFSIAVIFWITLAVLPAVIVSVKSTSGGNTLWTGRLFIPVAGFLVFNACDLGGRMAALLLPIPSKYQCVTLALSVARVVFIPLIMLCNAQPRMHLPVIFASDTSFVMLIFFFALTNGYLANVILMQAPKRVPEEYQELAGSQMAFFLGLGLMLGSVTSYGVMKGL